MISQVSWVRVCLVVVSTLATFPKLAHSAEYTLEQVHAAWRKRQDGLKSAHFDWTEYRLTPRGIHGIEEARPVPSDDTIHQWQSTLDLDGRMVRYDWSGMQWNEDRHEFVDQVYFSAADGKSSKSFFKRHSSSAEEQFYPIGFVHTGTDNTDIGGVSPLLPFLYSYRALDPVMGCTGPLWGNKAISKPTLTLVPNDGQMMLSIEESFDKGWKRTIVVDPDRDFLVRRFETSINRNRSSQLVVNYERNESDIWIPKNWKVEGWIAGPNNTRRLHYSVEAVLMSYTLNVPIDVSVFRPPFPPGTIVRDARSNKDHFVKADQTSREILPIERSRAAKYEEIAATEPGQAGLYRQPSKGGFYLFVAAIIAVVCIAVLYVKYRRSLG